MPANRREIAKAETRELILKAARAMFLEKGVDQCTMRGIAKAAGVSPASIIVHFKNKTSLLEVALNDEITSTVMVAIQSFPEEEDLLTRLLHTSRCMFAFYDNNRDLYRSLLKHTLLEPEINNPHITKELDNYIRFITCLIEDEQKKGALINGTDPHIAAMSVAGLYIGVLIMFFRDPSITPDAASVMLEQMTATCLTGILKGGNL
jgi:AcrR family transcriptional regulator